MDDIASEMTETNTDVNPLLISISFNSGLAEYEISFPMSATPLVQNQLKNGQQFPNVGEDRFVLLSYSKGSGDDLPGSSRISAINFPKTTIWMLVGQQLS